jgi:predicted ATPase
LTPLTVLLGPNGSGKSTLLDVLRFLSECFSDGLRRAWERRGRLQELRTRGEQSPITIQIGYREHPTAPLLLYQLVLDEEKQAPYVAKEVLQVQQQGGQNIPVLFFEQGTGTISGNEGKNGETHAYSQQLSSPDLLAASTFGQLVQYPHINALRNFLLNLHLTNFSTASIRSLSSAPVQKHLSQTGDNLAQVVQYLKEQHPQQFDAMVQTLQHRIPLLEYVNTETLLDGKILLQIKDTPFEQPVQAQYTSEGTLKLLAYMLLLYDPSPPPLIGIEEPESHLHPRLLQGFAEEILIATRHSQFVVTSHSPYFVNGLQPEEVWVLFRDSQGHTQVRQSSTIPGVQAFMQQGALLGDLWMEGYLRVGDPLLDTTKAISLQEEDAY